MKSTGSKLRDGTLAVFVAACMLLCVFSPVVLNWNEEDASASGASDDDTFRYVSLGDSMTNAYGSIDYYYYDEVLGYYQTCLGILEDDTYSYTNLLAKMLEDTYGDIDFRQLAVGGFRSEELRALLYDITPDRLKGDLDFEQRVSRALRSPDLLPGYDKSGNLPATDDDVKALADYFKESLIGADLITYQYLYDIGTPLFEPLRAMFAPGHEGSTEFDFSRYLGTEYGEMVEYVFDYIYNIIMRYLESAGDDVPLPPEMVSLVLGLAEGAAYGVVQYCSNFDSNMEWLYEVGYEGRTFEGKVVVLDAYNNYSDLVFDIAGMQIPFGDVLGALFDIANGYVKYVSPWADKVYFAELDESPDMMYDEFTDGGELTNDEKAVFFQSVFNLVGNDEAGIAAVLSGITGIPVDRIMVHDYNGNMTLFVEEFAGIYDDLDFDGNLSKFLDYAFSSTTMDFMGVFGQIMAGDVFEKLLTTLGTFKIASVSGLDLDIKLAEDGESVSIYDVATEDVIETYSPVELSTVFIALNLLAGDNPMSHPSQEGHEYLFECVLNAAPGGDQMVINFDPNGDYDEVFIGGVFSMFDEDEDNDDDFANTLPEIIFEMMVKDGGAALADADLVHIFADSGNLQFILGDILKIVKDLEDGTLSTYEPKDYEPLVGEDLASYVDKVRDMIYGYMGSYLPALIKEYGLDGALSKFGITPEDVSKIISIIADSVMYAYITSLASVVSIIDMVDSDASILLYGAYNTFNGFEFPIGDDATLPIGDIMDVFYGAYNYLVYQVCNMNDNVGYVDVTSAAPELDLIGLMSIMAGSALPTPDADVFAEGAQSWIGVENTYCEITWITAGGTRVDSVMYGTVPWYGIVPVPMGGENYTYEFAGWDKEVVKATGPATYVATYNVVPSEGATEGGSATLPVNVFDGTESQTIATKDWVIELPSAIFDGYDGDFTISVDIIDNADVPKDVIGFVGEKKVISLGLTIDGNVVSDFGEEVVTVSFNYIPDEGERMDNISVFWIDVENGRTVEYPAVFDVKTGMVTFDTTHFSYWYVDERTCDDDSSGFDVYVTVILVIVALLCAALLRMRR